MPLRASLAAISLVITSGLVTVINNPRPRALGLARLLVAADLLQSFPADPSQPVPALWQQRLGPNAKVAWSHSNRSWWQLWSRHDDGGAYLVLHADDLPPGQRPAGTVTVDDLLVIGADRLAAEQLKEPLGLRTNALQGLEQRCLERLQQGQAVYWSSNGLAGVLGPLSPLLTQWQQGCLSLQLDTDRLRWEGEAGAVPGLQGPRATPLSPPPADASTKGLPPGTLLAVRGSRLDQLLGGLLRRSLVRDSLASQYGLDAESLSRLGSSPFQMQLRTLPTGPFRLGLAVSIPIGNQRQAWVAALEQASAGISRQGLQAAPRGAEERVGQPAASITPQPRTWMRSDGTVVGGWRWLIEPNPDNSNRQRKETLVLFLGPPPPMPLPGPWTSPGHRLERQGEQVHLEVLMRPNGLAAQTLLPSTLPPLIHAADALVLMAGDDGPGRISPLSGELRLPR